MATVAKSSFFNTTVSDELQVPLVMVHFNESVVPAVTPVTPDVFDDGVVIDAVPLMMLHNPVPVVGEFPARVNELVLHNV